MPHKKPLRFAQAPEDLHKFMDCGILARGFAQLFCKTCYEALQEPLKAFETYARDQAGPTVIVPKRLIDRTRNLERAGLQVATGAA